MNDTKKADERVEGYVDEVGQALIGLDSEERGALLEDVREHAAAILSDEPGVDLFERLGSPRAFAQELLDSAGISATNRSARPSWRTRYGHAKTSRLGGLLARAGTEFTPAWAALRGVAAVWLITRLLGDEPAQQMPLLLVIGAVAGWMLSGRYREVVRRGTTGRLVGYAANSATAVVGLVLLFSWMNSFAPQEYNEAPAITGIAFNGDTVSAIQAFGPDGKPIPVALFDQNGSMISMEFTRFGTLTCTDELMVVPVPYLNSAGQPVANTFPARGVCVNAQNVVVGDATAETNGASVQKWNTSGLPASGQSILIDESGSYAGLTVGAPMATPSRSGSAAAKPLISLPTPSVDPSKK